MIAPAIRPVVVFDTNVLVSAVLSLQGAPFRCVALAKVGRVTSVTCPEILGEFRRILLTKLKFTEARADAAEAAVVEFSQVERISGTLRVVMDDPDDNKVVECAVVGRATHIVTGDRRHLLPLLHYQNIEIVSPIDFLNSLAHWSLR